MIGTNLRHQKLEATRLPLLVGGILLSTASINKWINKIPPVNSKVPLKGPRNKAFPPRRNSLEVHRLMAHPATVRPDMVRLSTIDNLTVEDATMAVVVAVHHGAAAVVQASTDRGTVVTAVVAVETAVCHGAVAACHGVAIKVVAALWTKTASQMPGMTC